MPTTTIRLPEDLKARVAVAAKRSGMTPHGFMLEAIAEKTEQENLDSAEITLTAEVLEKIEAVHRVYPNPAP